MNIIKPSYKIEDVVDGMAMLKRIELAGRTCYKSEDLITEDSAIKFTKQILDPLKRHESVIEHEKVTVRIICDRGVTHELVRHRLASYSQESTRYCNYSKNKFNTELTFIQPCYWKIDSNAYGHWKSAMHKAELVYFNLIELGATAQEARSVLPNSLKTEIVMTANLREWRHFFTVRAHRAAHPQMQEIAVPMLSEFKSLIPVIFDDIPGVTI